MDPGFYSHCEAISPRWGEETPKCSALGGFLAMLKSKADILGISIKEAPQFYASSKTCSSCGHKKEKLLLSEREYNCGACGISIDRDLNAAINLKHLAVGLAES